MTGREQQADKPLTPEEWRQMRDAVGQIYLGFARRAAEAQRAAERTPEERVV